MPCIEVMSYLLGELAFNRTLGWFIETAWRGSRRFKFIAKELLHRSKAHLNR